MKPLADMTPQERAKCRGQWCEDAHGVLYIYLGTPTKSATYDKETGSPMGTFINPREPDAIEAPITTFTPHFDLPCTWNSDGTPLAGKWDYRPEQLEVWGEWKSISHPTTDKAKAESWTTAKQFKNAKTRIMKRWVNQWEEA